MIAGHQLGFLAPDIIEAILDGRHPVELTGGKLIQNLDLPNGWSDQAELLGF